MLKRITITWMVSKMNKRKIITGYSRANQKENCYSSKAVKNEK